MDDDLDGDSAIDKKDDLINENKELGKGDNPKNLGADNAPLMDLINKDDLINENKELGKGDNPKNFGADNAPLMDLINKDDLINENNELGKGDNPKNLGADNAPLMDLTDSSVFDEPLVVIASAELVKTIEKGEKKKKKKKKKKSAKAWVWPTKSFLLSLIFAIFFSFFSESVISAAHITVSVAVLIALLLISILSDMVAISFLSCDISAFVSMSARKVRGAKTAVFLLKRAEIIGNILCDIIGDICAIVSGAAGVKVAYTIYDYFNSSSQTLSLVIVIGLSSLIAALTVGGKAFSKVLGRQKCSEIVFFISKILSIFNKNEKRNKKQ